MARGHLMPFGAALTESGVRFRLWAPAATTVDLKLEHARGPITMPMTGMGEGWFETVTPVARAGSRYRFRINQTTEVPDPASRYQPEDVHGPSVVVDPGGRIQRLNAQMQ